MESLIFLSSVHGDLNMFLCSVLKSSDETTHKKTTTGNEVIEQTLTCELKYFLQTQPVYIIFKYVVFYKSHHFELWTATETEFKN